MARRAVLFATFATAAIAVWVTVPAAAGPAVPKVESTRGFELAARCPQGFRRHTITGKCVRRQSRFPLLSWF